MDFKLELIAVPVSDVDRAKAFYEKAGFNADNDVQVNEELRFVQLTPPGSNCSISIGTGTTEMAPGSLEGLQMVVEDADAAREELAEPRHRGLRGPGLPLGPVRLLQRPGRERLGRPAGSGLRRGQDPARPRRVTATQPRSRAQTATR